MPFKQACASASRACFARMRAPAENPAVLSRFVQPRRVGARGSHASFTAKARVARQTERVSVVPQPIRNCARHPKLIPVYLRVRREIEAAGPGRMLEPRGEFEPKFAVEHVGILASAYTYWDDAKSREAGQQAAKRGWMTPAELVEIGSWKTKNRQRHNLEVNAKEFVHEVTESALAPGTSEAERLDRLCTLRGVRAPVASALLHFVDPDRWSILDYRILQSLGVERPNKYTFSFWERFQDATGAFAADAGVNRRCFDKAGFMWSRIYGDDLPEEIDDGD
jgi:hypothetical protein